LDVKQLVGARIKALRTKRGLTQEELSEQVGINPKYLSSIESGKENPTFNTLIALSESLGVDFGEMFNLLESEDPKASRRIVKSMVDDADDEQIRLIMKVILAVIG